MRLKSQPIYLTILILFFSQFLISGNALSKIFDVNYLPIVAPLASESFEGTYFWVQSTRDDMEWTRTSGSTPSSSTGPSSASNGSYYLYMEASGNTSKVARILTPSYTLDANYNLKFDYHMYGSNMGSLSVLISVNGGGWIQIWSISGDQGNQWNLAEVSLASYIGSTVQFRFDGTIGSGYLSDIAIDNLMIDEPIGCDYQLSLTSTENYVLSRSFQNAMSSSSLVDEAKDVIDNITYFDGLGRAKQQVGPRHSNTPCEDLVTNIAYDTYGRQTKEYLPYPETSSAGSYRSGDIDYDTRSYYNGTFGDDFNVISTANPYSEKQLEASPLNRVEKQAAPGYDWRLGGGHEIEFAYQANTAGEVNMYKVNLSSTFLPSINNMTSIPVKYPAGELYKTVTFDENHPGTATKNNSTEEFKDKQGKVVLKRTYNSGAAHDTYYLYDDYANLTYVIPPKVITSDGISSTELNELCYQYKYDKRNRLVEKKIPGKGTATNWESIVYNNLDQPIMTQDPNLKATNQWLFTKYDAFGRVAYTGLLTRTATRATLQAEADSNIIQFESRSPAVSIGGYNIYYTNNAYPKTYLTEIRTENYYDTYLASSAQAGISVPTGSNSVGEVISTATKGLPTVSKVRVLSTSNWITTVTAYEKKGRPVWTKSFNSYLGTTDLAEIDIDFVGKVLKNKTTHSKSGQTTITTIDTYNYDHMGRLMEQKQKVNSNATELIARNTYDELGQLVQKQVGGVDQGTGLQTVNFTYNVRGWLKEINNPGTLGADLFGFKLNYNTVSHSGIPLFNGNIAETEWKTQNDNMLRWYRYGYDNLNRITSATANSSNYNVSGISYDKNGNITNLTRRGAINSTSTSFGNMDVLAYGYSTSTNKLLSVNDTGNTVYGFKDASSLTTQYTYDLNGNLTSDANKGITAITYNHLNLPELVTIGGQLIDYTYDATGVKLRKEIPGKITDYAGNFVYEKIGTGANVLQFFSHPEGYVSYDGGQFNYVYNYLDHLGNVRLTYSDLNNNGTIELSSEILDEKNYYPFGLEHQGYNTNVISENNFMTFNGVELNQDLGLNLLEMDLRQYDPAIARWTSMDPVIHYGYSTYNAFDNNPVFWADPSGADAVYNWGKGKYYDEGKEVSFYQALESQGLNSNGSEVLPPTKFVTENGEVIADTDDGSNDVYVIRDENVNNFVKELKDNISNKEDINSEKNKNLGKKHGFDLNNIIDEFGLGIYKKDSDFQLGYFCGRDGGFGTCGGAIADMGGGKGGGKVGFGLAIGAKHKSRNLMNIFNPTIFDGNNFNIKVTPAGPLMRRYSEKPIPLIIDQSEQ